MPCNSKLSQKPKAVLKFERERFKLKSVWIKMMYLQICGSFMSAKELGPQIANPQIATIYGPQIANP
jgi:hypothetical protein